jgi:hypothetical protein
MDESSHNQEKNEWQYTGADETPDSPTHINPIEWSASEYISHEKDSVWYAAIVSISVGIAAIIWLITGEILASITILVVAFSGLFFAGRKPAVKKYQLSDSGLTIDENHYTIASFRSFSIVEEGAINSIWLKPLGRFTPLMILYCAPEDEERITEALSAVLPYEQRELDSIDRLMRRIRF